MYRRIIYFSTRTGTVVSGLTSYCLFAAGREIEKNPEYWNEILAEKDEDLRSLDIGPSTFYLIGTGGIVLTLAMGAGTIALGKYSFSSGSKDS